MAESVFESSSVHDFLRRELDRRLSTNSRYSLRAFARHLGMSPGELSEVLREKRPMSAKACQKVARALDLSPAEFKHLLVLAATATTERAERESGSPAPLRSPSVPLHLRRLDEDRFRLVSDWWCFAILNLLEVENFLWKSQEIAVRLGITQLQAQTAMDRLERLQLVRRQPPDRAVAAHDLVEHLSEVPSEAIRRYHRALLEKAVFALDSQSKEERDITGIGIAIDKKDLRAVAREIAEFQEQIIAKYGRKRRGRKFDSIYQLEVAFFRLDQELKP
jgi:uncharacterized protein (TIGR02147 family)